MHSFPIDVVKNLQTYTIESLEEWQKRFKKIKAHIFPHISTKEKQWVEKLFTDFFIILKKSSKKHCITHPDIMPEHIIVDPISHTLSGIIDFGDIGIGDPAFDFTFLGKYGKDFLKKTYEFYLLPRDIYFETRRQFYEDRIVVTNLDHYLWLKNKESIAYHKQLLSKYIVRHPLG